MNLPPIDPSIDPYAGRRKLLLRLRVAGVFGFMPLVGAANGLVVGAKHITTLQGLLAIALLILGGTFLIAPFLAAAKLQEEHPIEKKRTSPLDTSQVALAPTDARLQTKNDDERIKIRLIFVAMIPCACVLAYSPNIWATDIVGLLLITQMCMVRGTLRHMRRNPLQFEFAADAEGLHICWLKLQPRHIAWNEIQEASLVEEFEDSGDRLSFCLVFVFVDKRRLPYSIRLSSFKAEDAARFQSVVARYLKPPSVS